MDGAGRASGFRAWRIAALAICLILILGMGACLADACPEVSSEGSHFECLIDVPLKAATLEVFQRSLHGSLAWQAMSK